MRIGSDNEFIEISELARAPESTPNAGDVRVSVQIKLGEFGGRYDAVWLEEPILKCFISELESLENNRQGSASLESMSPNEFRLTIRSRDSLGHFVVEVFLLRYQYSGPTYWPTSVSGGFEVDPCALRLILDGFKELHESNG